jgi:hypothetical protein
MLSFFLYPQHTFYDTRGEVINRDGCPQIDQAAISGYTSMIRFILKIFGRVHRDNLLLNPLETINKVMTKACLHYKKKNIRLKVNYTDIFKILVPNLSLFTMEDGLKIVASDVLNEEIFTHALKHIDINFMPVIPDSVFVVLAQHSCISMFKKAVLFANPPSAPFIAYHQAFCSGQQEIVDYIMTLHPTYKPTSETLIQTCKNAVIRKNDTKEHVDETVVESINTNCGDMISSLPLDFPIPAVCLSIACKSASSWLVKVLHGRLPDVPFTKSMLWDAVKSNNSCVFLSVFDYGGFTEISKEMLIALVTHNQPLSLESLHKSGFKVYTDEVFLQSTRVGAAAILENMIKSGYRCPQSIQQEALRLVYFAPMSTVQKGEFFSQVNEYFSVLRVELSKQPSPTNQFTPLKRSKNVHN